MSLLSLNIDSIPIAQPLPFALRGADGTLLAQRGHTIRDRAELEALVSRGLQLCVDTEESGDSHRAYVAKLQGMLMSDQALGQIATTQISSTRKAPVAPSGPPLSSTQEWAELQLRTTQLLRSAPANEFLTRLDELCDEMERRCTQAPDATLLALFSLIHGEMQMYSATHAMLVSCICMLTGRDTLGWPPARLRQVMLAALTMNIAMSALQDQLAQQTVPPSTEQMARIRHHAGHSEALLKELGVADAEVLEAVRLHHHRNPGGLATRSPGDQMARLIQRADLYVACLATRNTRPPMSISSAIQACYYDEQHQVDEAGAALIKTLGLYPPGSLVRLASKEVGVVLRRGSTAAAPRVAVLISRTGMPTGELIPRGTALPEWKVVAPLSGQEVRVHLPLERLLALL